MERLKCHVQNYAWGKKGMNSEVARIYAAGHDVNIDEEKCYAELWMGTHPDGGANLKDCNMKLSKFIAEADSNTYKTVNEKHLPFIMKIMSIARTLSLQVHPTKEQAAKLNERDPQHYPDKNHKPELVYALTRFELLCGFRPASQIATNISAFPELRELMGYDTSNAFQALVAAGIDDDCETMRAALAVCFRKLISTSDKKKISLLVNSMLNKFDANVYGCLSDTEICVIRKMYEDFSDDIGCFSPLLLNHMILEPGECCYYAPKELHAYLSGECVECVGCSNNTIRAACTPKFIDVDALCEVLSYRMTDTSFYLVPPHPLEDYPEVVEFAPNCNDFILHKIQIPQVSTSSPIPIPSLSCGSILIIIQGEAILENLSEKRTSKKIINVSRGDIIYIEPWTQVCFSDRSSALLAFRTFSYEIGPDHSQRNVYQKLTVQRKGHAKYLIVDEDAEIFDVETELDGVC